MANFKVGDKVRVKYIPGFSTPDKRREDGKQYTICKIRDDTLAFIYDLDGDHTFWWHEKELELIPLTVKDKRSKLHEYCTGRWCGDCVLNHINCGFGGWCFCDEKVDEAYSIVFENKEKEEKDMNKFTKKDLKNGDVVKFKNGENAIAVVDTGTFVFADGYLKFEDVNSDLTYNGVIRGDKYTVMAVRRPTRSSECHLELFEMGLGNLVYERKEVEEMTLEEVCKALGKEIKIVKEK